MIYLLSQIGVSLLLAALFGSMIGWIVHRAQSGKKIKHLQQSLIKQQQQVNQAHTDVAMLTEDFNDLKQRSSAEIDTLQAENRKMPLLNQNLEKSQLLVRQMMQKHEAQIRELSIENASMAERLKLVKDREQTLSKLQAELEIERRSHAKKTHKSDKLNGSSSTGKETTTQTELNLNAAPTTASLTASDAKAAQATRSQSVQQQNEPDEQVAASAPPVETAASNWASKPVTPAKASTPEASTPEASTPEASTPEASTPEASTPEAATPEAATPEAATPEAAAPEAAAPEASTPEAATPEAATPESPTLETTKLGAEAQTAELENKQKEISDATAELTELHEQLSIDASDATPDHATPEMDTTTQRVEKPVTEKKKALKPLFEPVDQHDDLKQIFGIGPVTEKTLNKLGLTSYSQLAELKRHDIEKIADALQIFPGRIERDNWVGSARQQLEAVLEDL